MSVFGFLRPKYKHPDPAVRAAAVAKLNEEPILAEIALTDECVDVARAALQRVTAEDLRADVARSSSPLNIAALEGISDPALLAAIAQHAQSATVRAQATARVVDTRILHKVAAHDADPAVRLQARSRLGDANRMHQYLRTLLSRLPTGSAPPPEGSNANGGLDEVCAAVMHDARFQIDAVLAEPAAAGSQPAGAGAGTASSGGLVELLAHSRVGESAESTGQVTHFQIRICRRGENDFQWWMTERRAAMTHDVESWASSSRG